MWRSRRGARCAAAMAGASICAMRCETASRSFIEVNPLAGLNPERSDLVFIARFRNMSYRDLIGRIMAERSIERHPGLLPAAP